MDTAHDFRWGGIIDPDNINNFPFISYVSILDRETQHFHAVCGIDGCSYGICIYPDKLHDHS